MLETHLSVLVVLLMNLYVLFNVWKIMITPIKVAPRNNIEKSD